MRRCKRITSYDGADRQAQEIEEAYQDDVEGAGRIPVSTPRSFQALTREEQMKKGQGSATSKPRRPRS